MKTQSLRWVIGLGAAACSFGSCTQPATECLTGLGNGFATVFTAQGAPTPAGCEMANPKVVQMGEIVNFEWYHPPTGDLSTFNDDASTVAIKTNSMGTEYYAYNGGCPSPACSTPLPCTFVPGSDAGADDAGAGSNGDSDCDPTGMLHDLCKDTTSGGPCGASSTECACATATCVADADCSGGACVNGTCHATCGPAAGCAGPCATDDDCAGAVPSAAAMTCVMGQCVASCGSCPTGQTCGGDGTPGICGSGSTCAPATCADLGANCGPTPDGCGGLLDCGTCPQPPVCMKDSDCGLDGPCLCSDGSPPPCADGMPPACSNPQTCGGNGAANVCGHPVPDPKAADTLFALGGFAQHYPDGNDMCQVTGLTSAAQTFSTVPAGAIPTDTVGYTWSKVNVYVTAAAQGTQFSADVTYTDNGCSATYHAVGVFPAIDCTAPVIDPTDPRGLNVIGVQPDNTRCCPYAQPDKGIFVGSGISPDFPVKCTQIFPTTCTDGLCQSADPFGRDPYYCVLMGANDPPQLTHTQTCGEP